MIPYGTVGHWDGKDLVIRVPNAANLGSISAALSDGNQYKLLPCERCSSIGWVARKVISFTCEMCSTEDRAMNDG